MKLVATFVAFVFLSGAAHAATGSSFLEGLPSPEDLANRIEVANQLDESGNRVIDPDKCNPKSAQSCATAQDYLQMFQQSDPQSGLTKVSQLPGYLLSVEVEPAPKGMYWMACLKPLGNGKHEPVLHCVQREFKPGEKAWVHRATRRVVFASRCGNPVEKKVEEPCARVRYETRKRFGDQSVSFTYCGPTAVTSDCWGVQTPGQTDIQPWWKDSCPVSGCSFADVERALGERCWTVGSEAAEVDGYTYLYVPGHFATKGSPYRVVSCLHREHEDSDAIGVRAPDYVYRSPKGEKEARIEYGRDEVSQGAPLIYWPWGEWNGR